MYICEAITDTLKTFHIFIMDKHLDNEIKKYSI